jgi:regulator of protease activity HflC (stomatin/prohibitin superfamily)
MDKNTYTVKPNSTLLKKGKKFILPLILIIAAIIVLSASIKIVPAGSTGVVMTLGKVNDTVMQEGLNFKIPFIQTVSVVNNKIQVIEVDAPAVSKDLQTVNSVIAVNYRVGLDSSANIYKNIGQDYQTILLLPAVQESIKSVTAKYTAEELITMRAQVGVEIKTALEEKVNEYGIVIEKFNIVNFDFSAEFNSAIEAKQVAEQNLIKTKTEQEQAIVIAEAEAKRKIIEADAEAESVLKKANAQAEANKKLSESLNDTIVEYEKIQKWNGELPMSTGGSSIFDFRSKTE